MSATSKAVNPALNQLLKQYGVALRDGDYPGAKQAQGQVAVCMQKSGASVEQTVQRLVLDAVLIVDVSGQENVSAHARSLAHRSVRVVGRLGASGAVDQKAFASLAKVAIAEFRKVKGMRALTPKAVMVFSGDAGKIMEAAAPAQVQILNTLLAEVDLNKVGMSVIKQLAADSVRGAVFNVMSWFRKK